MSRSSTILLAVVLLLLVWAVLATMALNKAKESNDAERTAYVDSVNAATVASDLRVKAFYDTLAAKDRLLDSLRNIRVNTVVLHEQARQDVQRMDMDSVFSILDAPPQ